MLLSQYATLCHTDTFINGDDLNNKIEDLEKCILIVVLGTYGGGERCAQRSGKPEGNRPLGRPRRRWEDNIKMDLQEVGGSCGDWVELSQDRERWQELGEFLNWLQNQLASEEGLCCME